MRGFFALSTSLYLLGACRHDLTLRELPDGSAADVRDASGDDVAAVDGPVDTATSLDGRFDAPTSLDGPVDAPTSVDRPVDMLTSLDAASPDTAARVDMLPDVPQALVNGLVGYW